MNDKRVVAQGCYEQSDQLRRNDVEADWADPIPMVFVHELLNVQDEEGALGIALMWDHLWKSVQRNHR